MTLEEIYKAVDSHVYHNRNFTDKDRNIDFTKFTDDLILKIDTNFILEYSKLKEEYILVENKYDHI